MIRPGYGVKTCVSRSSLKSMLPTARFSIGNWRVSMVSTLTPLSWDSESSMLSGGRFSARALVGDSAEFDRVGDTALQPRSAAVPDGEEGAGDEAQRGKPDGRAYGHGAPWISHESTRCNQTRIFPHVMRMTCARKLFY